MLFSTNLQNWQEAALIRSAGLPYSLGSGFTGTVPDTTGQVEITAPAGGKGFFKLDAKTAR